MKFTILFLSFLGARLFYSAQALSLPLTVSQKEQPSDSEFGLQNDLNNLYFVELTVSGQTFRVQLDSGSSDLWLDTSGVDVSSFTDTHINATITYFDTTAASGPVLITNVTLGNFSTHQAFISAPGSNATHGGDKGLLGIGPPKLSQVEQALDGSSFDGSNFLQNIFDDSQLSEFFTIGLSRSTTTGLTDGGIFTISEIADSHSNVTDNPELDVILPNRWTVLMDGMIINGKSMSGHSVFHTPGQGPDQTWTMLDTGDSFAVIPSVYADAIYGDIPGAVFSEQSGQYTLPCDTKINISFVFGGQEYPVHPIDTVRADVDAKGSIFCFSGFTAANISANTNSQDFQLGDSFLRNVYALFDFGSLIRGLEAPQIKLQSTTDADQAYSEFDSLSSQRNQSLAKSAPSSSSAMPSAPTNADASKAKNAATSMQPILLGSWLTLAAVAMAGATVVY